MTQNLILAELPVADTDEVLQHLADIKTKLNFLLSLQASDITGQINKLAEVSGKHLLPRVAIRLPQPAMCANM